MSILKKNPFSPLSSPLRKCIQNYFVAQNFQKSQTFVISLKVYKKSKSGFKLLIV